MNNSIIIWIFLENRSWKKARWTQGNYFIIIISIAIIVIIIIIIIIVIIIIIIIIIVIIIIIIIICVPVKLSIGLFEDICGISWKIIEN